MLQRRFEGNDRSSPRARILILIHTHGVINDYIEKTLSKRSYKFQISRKAWPFGFFYFFHVKVMDMLDIKITGHNGK